VKDGVAEVIIGNSGDFSFKLKFPSDFPNTKTRVVRIHCGDAFLMLSVRPYHLQMI